MTGFQLIRPVIKHVSQALVHTPGLVCHGSRPARELSARPELLPTFQRSLRPFGAAVQYLPHQVYVGGAHPDTLWEAPEPWFERPFAGDRFGTLGEIMPETEFYGLIRLADEYDLVTLEAGFAAESAAQLTAHPFLGSWMAGRSLGGVDAAAIEQRLAGGAVALRTGDGRLAGCVRGDHPTDDTLKPGVMLENLACKASGFLALRHLLVRSGLDPNAAEYVIACGEEGIGDGNQRSGGSMGKIIGAMAGCREASGADVKAFCCGPMHALVTAAALVASGVYRNVLVVAGGCVAKLGIKLLGHLDKGMPIIEDVLGSFAAWVTADDGVSPAVRLDAVGRLPARVNGAQQEVWDQLIFTPLARLGLKLDQVDRYATELHNPEATVPAGSGDVPRLNYRSIAAAGVLHGQWQRERLDQFQRLHGSRGFGPTQGHIPSGVPYLGHAWTGLIEGSMRRAMFIGKGGLFLSRMTRFGDALSFVLERNPALGPERTAVG